MKPVTLLFFFLISINVTQAQTNDACLTLKNAITQQKTEFSNLSDLPIEKIANPETSQAYFVGEDHGDTSARRLLRPLIERMKAANMPFDCMFIEVTDATAQVLRDYGDGKVTRWDILQKTRDALCQEAAVIFPNRNCPDAKAFEPLLSDYIELAKQSASLGVRIYGDDVSILFPSDSAISSEFVHFLDSRNAFMASFIQQKHQSGECKRSLINNGLYHVVVDSEDGSPTSVPTRLESAGMKVEISLAIQPKNLAGTISRSDCPVESSFSSEKSSVIQNFESLPGGFASFIQMVINFGPSITIRNNLRYFSFQ